MNNKKKEMIEALKKQLGVVTAATKQVGIDRTTHYLWLNKDSEYAKAVNDIPEIVIDFAENALFQLIQEKNPTAIIFFLKTKAKHRGYIEKIEHETHHTGEIGVKLEETERAIQALKEYENRIKRTESN